MHTHTEIQIHREKDTSTHRDISHEIASAINKNKIDQGGKNTVLLEWIIMLGGLPVKPFLLS